ncbi:MAG: GGDEF domain-containing protein [Caldimonas sp.]|uniref:GGDEF domain-containing protein n=1 Tax=Caldimonas sp. TaxID=2838790 RepID=UPI0039191797
MDFSIVSLAAAALGLLLALVLALTIPHVPESQGTGYWAAAFIPLGVGSALISQGEQLPALWLLLREPLLLLGYALLLIGLRQYLRLERPWALAGAVLFSGLVLSAVFVAVVPSPEARLAIRTGGIAILMGAMVWTLHRVGGGVLAEVRWFLQGACGLIAVLAVLRLLGLAWLAVGAEMAESVRTAGIQLASMVTTLCVLAVICGLTLLMTARMNEALLQLTIRDPLTGVFNRRGLDDAMATVLAFARRVGRPVALLVCDIDHFKRVNDTFGHAQGDAVLRDFARLLVEHVPEADLVGRLGGEEFAVVLPGADGSQALREAERLRAVVAAHGFSVQGQRLPLTASFGVASAPGAQASWAELIARADAALYDAKAQGRNRCVLAPSALAVGPRTEPAVLVAGG